jgi:hypothetical protein
MTLRLYDIGHKEEASQLRDFCTSWPLSTLNSHLKVLLPREAPRSFLGARVVLELVMPVEAPGAGMAVSPFVKDIVPDSQYSEKRENNSTDASGVDERHFDSVSTLQRRGAWPRRQHHWSSVVAQLPDTA